MPDKFRWGILGPGRIARKFAASLPFSIGGVLNAVASTNPKRGQAFAKEFVCPQVFQSYEELAASCTVDAVYIATPHAFHRRDVEICLHHRLPVLCEKPLTTNPEDTLYLLNLAAEKKVFFMEGLWTCCLPSFRQALQWIEEGRIGEVLHAEANFGHKVPLDLSQRHFNPELGGGVMKDIGIYPLALFLKVFGHGLQIQSSGIRLENGVDAQVVFQGKNADGSATFQGLVSFLATTGAGASVSGTEGRIVFDPQWFRTVDVRLEIPGKKEEVFYGKSDTFGFQFEANEVERCVRNGWLESPLWTHADTLEAARLTAIAGNFST
jgi:predicted dehydrogenase